MISTPGNKSHIPVLAEQVVRYLVVDDAGAYLDLTAGYGGHLKVLSKVLKSEARLYGFDIDNNAVGLAIENLKGCPQKVKIVNDSYINIKRRAVEFDDAKFDGILLDLGLSSMQLDEPKRGFSFQQDGPLDMRFGSQFGNNTATDIINKYDEKELTEIFYKFGEERKAKELAAIIVRERRKMMIETTAQLSNIISSVGFARNRTKILARIFQALRIAVNDELRRIEEVLPAAADSLKKGGRLAVISYHSLEDRIIKNYFKRESTDCVCPPEFPVCACDHKATLKIISKKLITPDNGEIENNSRARSAKMRIAEKI